MGSGTCMRTTYAGNVVSHARGSTGTFLVNFRTFFWICDLVLYVYIYIYIGRERERERKRERCTVDMYKYIYINIYIYIYDCFGSVDV